MFTNDYKWQHDYVRLAFDTGFHFERHKSDNSDKNKISSVNIDRIIEERDIETVEKLIPSVTKFVLDPEQAQILDENFVKTFRLSQLSIQYLLFCNRYLDNTLVIVKDEIKKVKEDNEELNFFVEDLKSHVSKLMKELDERPTFNCDLCSKRFSSEEFLKSHKKRRHSGLLLEAETDKLQMEIKELKGRLNNTEKMIQKEQTEVESGAELKKIEELQMKFEDLRLQVQSELKILQTQHNFQEKYEKWFEKMALQGGKFQEKGGGDSERKKESTTQTANLNEIEAKNKENIPEINNAQKQMTEFGEALETKVTSSLQKIESQMQSFWNKLNEMERFRKGDEDFEKKKPKPMVRSRSKQVLKSVDSESQESQNEDKSLEKSEEVEESTQTDDFKEKEPLKVVAPKIVATQVKKNVPMKKPPQKVESGIQLEDEDSSETIPSESEPTIDSPEEEPIKPMKPVPVPRRNTSDKTNLIIDEELLRHFRPEVEKIIMGRLQELGVSPEWKGLPTRSFQRAIEIVNHQANLVKKTHPNFDLISAQIEKTVARKVEENGKRKKLVKPKVRKVVTKEKFIKSPKLEIKNRKMYESDSDSDRSQKENLKQFSVPYSKVIEELKAVTSKIESEKSEVQTKAKVDDQTRGVLKSYPSAGSLTKKKVLFNLASEEEKKDVFLKDGGSTTSVASSVFDPTPRKEDTKKESEKDIEDLSDFDFSEM